MKKLILTTLLFIGIGTAYAQESHYHKGLRSQSENTVVLQQNRISMVEATTGQELAMWMMLPLLEKHLQTPSYVVKSFCDCTNWPTMLSKQVTL